MVESAGAACGRHRAVRSPLAGRDLLPAGRGIVAAVVALLRRSDGTLSREELRTALRAVCRNSSCTDDG